VPLWAGAFSSLAWPPWAGAEFAPPALAASGSVLPCAHVEKRTM